MEVKSTILDFFFQLKIRIHYYESKQVELKLNKLVYEKITNISNMDAKAKIDQTIHLTLSTFPCL